MRALDGNLDLDLNVDLVFGFDPVSESLALLQEESIVSFCCFSALEVGSPLPLTLLVCLSLLWPRSLDEGAPMVDFQQVQRGPAR